MAVVEAVERDLAEIAKRDKTLAESALALTALALAREIDKPNNSATSKAMCAKTLMDALEKLAGLAPAGEEHDKIDELRKRRAAKLGVAGA